MNMRNEKQKMRMKNENENEIDTDAAAAGAAAAASATASCSFSCFILIFQISFRIFISHFDFEFLRLFWPKKVPQWWHRRCGFIEQASIVLDCILQMNS